jgi:hypothetical protein
MAPLIWLDVSLIISGFVFVTLAAWRLRRRQGPTLGGVLMFVLGMGQLAAAAVDVGLSEWDKFQRTLGSASDDGPPVLLRELVDKLAAGPLGSASDDGPPFLTEGKPAPDFCLPSLDDGRSIRLSDFRGRKPVFLVFSSFTCEIFCAQVVHLHQLHKDFGDRVQFLFVAVRDAQHSLHPELQHVAEAANSVGTRAKRQLILQAGMKHYQLSFPCLVDTEEHEVEKQYRGAHPLRIVLVDRQGQRVFDSGPVPYVPLRWDKIDSWVKAQGRSSPALPSETGRSSRRAEAFKAKGA